MRRLNKSELLDLMDECYKITWTGKTHHLFGTAAELLKEKDCLLRRVAEEAFLKGQMAAIIDNSYKDMTKQELIAHIKKLEKFRP